MRLIAVFSLFFFEAHYCLAQGNGAIPLQYRSSPATDLIYREQKITASEAFELAQQGVDLSLLEPAEDQDIWRSANPNAGSSIPPVLLMPEQEIQFKDFVLSQTGKLRFLGKDQNGMTLNFSTSKNVHAQLMRRNLLVRLGYVIPEIRYVPKIKIRFNSVIDREVFEKELTQKTLGDAHRWIEERDDTSIVIHDLIVQAVNPEIVDLSVGYLPSEMIRGKRVLNALHVVYSVTDFNESANLFSWSAGYVFNDYLHLPYPFESEFYASLEDVRWMARKIASLERRDWEAIVRESQLPVAVEKLIVEKMIARRNHLITLSGIEGASLSYDPRISWGDALMDGELIQEKFEGYAARFSYGDPESPMNLHQLLDYGGVKTIGTLVDQIISKFNALPFLNNTKELEYQILERYNRNFLKQVFEYYKTGQYRPVPFGVYALPSVNGSVVASRDVIAGNYLGTDNLFQLVDTIGISGFAGVYIGTEGFESITNQIPINGSGKSGIFYNRLYSHVKPIQSMKAALRYPISNVLVPLAELKIGSKMKSLIQFDDSGMSEQEKKEMLEKLVPVLNSKMLPGESFIITDSVGDNLSMQIGAGFGQFMKAELGISGSQVILSRLQIYKVNDEEYQIYRDRANTRSFMVQGGIREFIPLLKIKFARDRGNVKMDFYKIKLNPNVMDEEEKKKYTALRDVFLTGDLDRLKVLQEPIRFRYRLRQNFTQGTALIFQKAKVNSKFDLRILHPQGQQLDLFRRYEAESDGMNFEIPGAETMNVLVKLMSKKDFGFQGYDGGGNAGFTLFGRAKTKTRIFESSKNYLEDEDYSPIVKINRIWNGWSIHRRKALKILKEIRDRYRYDFYPPDVLNETNQIFLYSFHVHFSFYREAIRHISQLTDEKIDEIAATESKEKIIFRRLKVHRLKSLIHRLEKTSDLNRISSLQNRIFDLIESVFTLRGMELLCGGREHFFVYSKIEGFRSQDENGDQPIFSSSFGEYGHFMVSGPFDYLRRLLGMTESELGVNWMLRRIY
jgi:hypothetical protein